MREDEAVVPPVAIWIIRKPGAAMAGQALLQLVAGAAGQLQGGGIAGIDLQPRPRPAARPATRHTRPAFLRLGPTVGAPSWRRPTSRNLLAADPTGLGPAPGRWPRPAARRHPATASADAAPLGQAPRSGPSWRHSSGPSLRCFDT